MKRFSRRSYKEEIVSTVWRHFAAVPITGLLLASTATIAM
ncbi:MAG: lactococcin 972 family bacteriocin, partial [Cutibacterium acnes]|nr:lactococcin 972 family bacteriocin [Cutibacterium acnes]